MTIWGPRPRPKSSVRDKVGESDLNGSLKNHHLQLPAVCPGQWSQGALQRWPMWQLSTTLGVLRVSGIFEHQLEDGKQGHLSWDENVVHCFHLWFDARSSISLKMESMKMLKMEKMRMPSVFSILELMQATCWSCCCNTEDSGRIDLNMLIAILAHLPLPVFYLEASLLSTNIKESRTISQFVHWEKNLQWLFLQRSSLWFTCGDRARMDG